jgi:chemotaxis response regulator CheB
MRTTIPSSDGRGGATQRVLVIGNSSLLGEGIESILRNERGLSIQSINVDDEESLFRRIRELDPDVIVLVEQTAPHRSVSQGTDLGGHASEP